ncbi:regulator [Xenorhabdus bovienii]|uniref:regulator n=1 Tax=Xenorhabdus bovienii TaxID=40576 RepID=UPI0023B3490F|nr:regulator [Xenorhabdus bovienii]MDE9454548.1 regulator [Xenorhabdus bovienii]MDE9568785.1 regulator [Xenorhabdus bovienii]
MSTLLDLIRAKRQDMATKRASRGVDIVKLQNGIQYLRVFPNPEDPNGVFYQQFGMHFVKAKEDGKDKTVATVCKTATYGESCEICEAVMEAKAIYKGNKNMEEAINEIRSSQRYLVNGTVTPTPDMTSITAAQLIELAQTVFEDLMKSIEEDMADEIGLPLDAKEGYCFKVERTGAGRDTKYTVSPVRKDGKAAIPANLLSTMHNLENFANGQVDANKLAIASKAVSSVTGVSVSVSSTLALPATGTTGTALPGFSALVGDVPFDGGTKSESLIKEEAASASAAEFTDASSATASAAASTPNAPEALASSVPVADDELEKMMAQLTGL